MRAAAAAGDDDEAERLHARYIELGTTYAGRLAAGWRSTTRLIARIGESDRPRAPARARASPCSRSSRAAPTRRCWPTPCPRSAIRSRRCTSRTPCAGDESEADAAACRALAAALGVPHRELAGPVAPGPGVEARARAQQARGRGRAARRARRRDRAHARRPRRDDPLPPGRLAGQRGVRGAARRRRRRARAAAARARAAARCGRRCERAGIAWREDSSNVDRSFARNRVRLDLLPAFRSLHPAAEANLLRTAALLAEDEAALDALAARAARRDRRRSRRRPSPRAPAPSCGARCAASRASRRRGRSPPSASAALARSRRGAGSVPLGAGRRGRAPLRPHRDRARRACAGARARGRARRAGRHALRRCRRALRAGRPARRALDAALAPRARAARAASRRAPAGRAAHDRAHAARGAGAAQRARSLPCRRRAWRARRASGHRSGSGAAPTDWTRAHHRRIRDPLPCRSRRRARGRPHLRERRCASACTSSASRSRATTRASTRCSSRCSRAP